MLDRRRFEACASKPAPSWEDEEGTRQCLVSAMDAWI
jgi:hypothetical protein